MKTIAQIKRRIRHYNNTVPKSLDHYMWLTGAVAALQWLLLRGSKNANN